MKIKTLSELKCSDCYSNLKSIHVSAFCDKAITYGVVRCTCSEYPIVEGILIYKKQTHLKKTIRYIQDNKNKEALLSVTELGSALHKRILVRLFRTKMPLNELKYATFMFFLKMFSPKYVEKKVNFVTATKYWGTWGKYIHRRFFSNSFIKTIIFLNNAGIKLNKDDKILDLCCGAGHFSSIFRQRMTDAEIFSCDKNFVNLFFLKRYFCENAVAICCDANLKLPFKKDYFSFAFNSDSFHYLTKKEECISEVFRILEKEGLILFSHLHNKLVKNAGQGVALTNKEYYEVFKRFNCQIYSEREILHKFLKKEKIDLNSSDSEEKLNKSNAFIIFGKKNFS